jgi:hypothetical protein
MGVMRSSRSWRGVAVGAVIALTVPVSYLALAFLILVRVIPDVAIRGLLNEVGTLGWISLVVLGPAGIAIACWSAGARRLMTWIALLIIAIPGYIVVWAWSVFSLSGVLGNPF